MAMKMRWIRLLRLCDLNSWVCLCGWGMIHTLEGKCLLSGNSSD